MTSPVVTSTFTGRVPPSRGMPRSFLEVLLTAVRNAAFAKTNCPAYAHATELSGINLSGERLSICRKYFLREGTVSRFLQGVKEALNKSVDQ
jgi:hypothetical protein